MGEANPGDVIRPAGDSVHESTSKGPRLGSVVRDRHLIMNTKGFHLVLMMWCGGGGSGGGRVHETVSFRGDPVKSFIGILSLIELTTF